jgi:hypothetical protein
MTRRTAARAALLLLALAGAGCAQRPPRGAAAKAAFTPGCQYEARLVNSEEFMLEVEARCTERRIESFRVIERAALGQVRDVRDERGEPLRASGQLFELDGREPSIRYRVELGAIARAEDDFDLAARVGDSVIAPVSTWVLEPNPVRAGAPLWLRVVSPAGSAFTSALREEQSGLFGLEQHELRVASYSAFGRLEQQQLSLEGRNGQSSKLEIVFLDGALDLDRPAWLEFVTKCAHAVASFYGGFPVPRATLFVIPRAGRAGILFGKVLPESSPGIALLVGQHTKPAQLADDWILVHELYHLGFPSFQGEGKWLDEGLATYYEPIIRVRAGYRSEASLWEEFSSSMPQGLAALAHGGLEAASNFRGIYWGGAIVCLLADVEIRQRSGGRQGLEHGLFALLDAGGHSSEVWALSDAIRTVDRATGAPVLAKLAARHARHGHTLDLARLFHDLGVERTPRWVVLDDRAPLAAVRRAIVAGH